MKKFPALSLLILLAASLLSSCAAAPRAALPAPTLDRARWKVYQDLEHHFSFEYPKAFDDRPLCAAQVKPASAGSASFSVSLNNSNLKVSLDPLPDARDSDPQSAVDALRGYWGASQRVSFDAPLKLTVAGVPALAQRYHTVYSQDGYLENVFFKKGGILYTVFLNTPATCDGYPDTPSAVEAFQRILSSFQIQ